MHLLRTLSRQFSHLRWQLTFSHTLTTIVALFFLEILGALLIFWSISANTTAIIANSLETYASELASQNLLLPNKQKQLQDWLSQNISLNTNLISYQGYVAILDKQGNILATRGQKTPPSGTSIYRQLSSRGSAALQQMLQTTSHFQTMIYQESTDTTVILVPIKQQDQMLQGIAVIKASDIHIDLPALFSTTTVFIIATSLLFVPCAGLIGALFGILIARGFIIRFRNLSGVVEQWSQGNFAVFSQDRSHDEIGQLAQHLNRMAEQLQNLLQARQELASIQERNRLARDLHDSIKQQMFSVALQIGTARVQLNHDTQKASTQLYETETQVLQIQQELTTLIHQLRPVVVQDKGLVPALHEYLAQWQASNDISVTFHKEGEYLLPWHVEDTFYRVAQEALSNVARHSHATTVQLILSCHSERTILTIQDNGRGFDAKQQQPTGIGLQSMQERLLRIGGTLTIDSNTTGTSIKASCQPQQATISVEQKECTRKKVT